MLDNIVTKTRDRQENLCDTCVNSFPECEPDDGLIEYGGPGLDNVITCNCYIPEGKDA